MILQRSHYFVFITLNAKTEKVIWSYSPNKQQYTDCLAGIYRKWGTFADTLPKSPGIFTHQCIDNEVFIR